MGSVNHLNSFIPNVQMHTAKFKGSLSKGNKKKFYWSSVQTEAFEELKKLIANIKNNYHYSTSRETRIKCDASKKEHA